MPLRSLNKEQFEAATAPFGENLIIASAGTGKTSTIVARIGYLLNKGVDPKDILLLTFTNKAASEMVQRVGRFFDEKTTKQIESGTFHAVSYRLLKKYGNNIVLKQPSELKVLLKTVYEKRVFHHIDASVKPYGAAYLYDLFSLYQNKEPSLSFGEWINEQNEEHEPFSFIYEDIIEEFKELKEKFGYVDFNDLLIKMKLFLSKEKLIFKEILVDEYQDTNRLQGSLIDSFKANSLFCVGDYDQSIYAFNGADINIIATFKERYKNGNIFVLSKNYRSSKHILSLANRVINHNPRIFPKKLEVTRDGDFNSPKLLIYSELFEQYHAIAKLIKLSSTPKEQIAVLFRNNSSADGIEASLREIGVGCKRRGGISFFDTKEIKAMLDLYSIVVNPKDMMAFIHIFEYAKGVGSVFAKELFDALYLLGNGNIIKGLLSPKDIKNPFKQRKTTNHQLGLFDDYEEFGSVCRFSKFGFEERFYSNPILKHSKFNDDSVKFLYAFYIFIKEARKFSLPKDIVVTIFRSTIFNHISSTLAKRRATLKDGSVDTSIEKEANEKIKVKAALLHDLSLSYSDSRRFLNAMLLGSKEMSEGEGVNLLSVHASKGLEYKEVYIIDLMDGRFPNRKLISRGGDIEEERRLFYVAVTRAKDILYLSYASYDRVKKIDYLPSPFLKEAGLGNF